jgi:cysteine desulfurase
MIAARRDRLAAGLEMAAPFLIVSARDEVRHPGSLHLRFPGTDADDLLLRLQPMLAAATGSACTSGMVGDSHVLQALGWPSSWCREAIRFSLGRFTRDDEIEAAIELISRALLAAEMVSFPSSLPIRSSNA